MRLLLTRPAEDSRQLAETLGALGHETVIAPLLEIVYLDEPAPDCQGVQALLATSANGVRAFARLTSERAVPLFAVGDASARCARQAGFADVESASGDVESLARLVAERLDPGQGALLHIAGSDLAGDLGGRLEGAGFTCLRAVLYRAHQVSALPAAAAREIAAGRIDGVVLYSPRSAESFCRLAEQAGLSAALTGVTAYCLSAAVAVKARALSWGAVAVAARPDGERLLALLAAP